MYGTSRALGQWGCRCAHGNYFILVLLVGMLGTGCVTPDGGGPGDDGGVVAREIEEADIVKLVDGYFYLSNPYTGLRIIDARDMDRPALAGRLALGGRGVELIVRDHYALVFTAADFAWCAGEPVDFDDPIFDDVVHPPFSGSRIWVVDVSDKSAPALVSTVDFAGFIAGTRRVGDFLYAAGNIGSSTFVASVDISDPAHVNVVQELRFSGDADDIHVSPEAIYLFGDDSTLLGTTLVSYVDITSTNGLIERRDSFRVPGRVTNRYFMDAHEDAFRIVTEELVEETFTRRVALYVFDVSDPDEITRIAELPIVTGESLRAVRFDGERGYAVTFQTVDPLFVLDLSDPDSPQVAGELTVPGFSTHLVPLGERLIGVGFATGADLQPAVSLYDVSDPDRPQQLARVVIGGFAEFGTSSEATVDEKALSVLPEAGLVLLPYAVFDRDTGDWTDGLQLIELTANSLRERGRIAHTGIVRRSGLHDERLWLLSDRAFASVDVEDLDAPQPLRRLELISEQELLDAGLLACADSARNTGTNLFFGSFLCGSFFGPPFFVTVAGLAVLRLRQRRRWLNRGSARC